MENRLAAAEGEEGIGAAGEGVWPQRASACGRSRAARRTRQWQGFSASLLCQSRDSDCDRVLALSKMLPSRKTLKGIRDLFISSCCMWTTITFKTESLINNTKETRKKRNTTSKEMTFGMKIDFSMTTRNQSNRIISLKC